MAQVLFVDHLALAGPEEPLVRGRHRANDVPLVWIVGIDELGNLQELFPGLGDLDTELCDDLCIVPEHHLGKVVTQADQPPRVPALGQVVAIGVDDLRGDPVTQVGDKVVRRVAPQRAKARLGKDDVGPALSDVVPEQDLVGNLTAVGLGDVDQIGLVGVRLAPGVQLRHTGRVHPDLDRSALIVWAFCRHWRGSDDDLFLNDLGLNDLFDHRRPSDDLGHLFFDLDHLGDHLFDHFFDDLRGRRRSTSNDHRQQCDQADRRHHKTLRFHQILLALKLTTIRKANRGADSIPR